MTLHRLTTAALLATALAGAATAQPGAPTPVAPRPVPPGDPLAASPVGPVEVVRGHALVSARIDEQAGAIVACASRGATIKASVRLTWDGRGRVRTATVSGGNASFNRCATAVLRRPLPAPGGRGGTGTAVMIVRAPAPPPVPRPWKGDLSTCKVDDDCILFFRTAACIPNDPIAINKLAVDQARKTYPLKRIDCAMGGPQYEKLRLANEGRWTTRCDRARCVVDDRGPQPTLFD